MRTCMKACVYKLFMVLLHVFMYIWYIYIYCKIIINVFSGLKLHLLNREKLSVRCCYIENIPQLTLCRNEERSETTNLSTRPPLVSDLAWRLYKFSQTLAQAIWLVLRFKLDWSNQKLETEFEIREMFYSY